MYLFLLGVFVILGGEVYRVSCLVPYLGVDLPLARRCAHDYAWQGPQVLYCQRPHSGPRDHRHRDIGQGQFGCQSNFDMDIKGIF